VPSTAIRDSRYDPRAHELTVTFVSGAIYAYADVPEETWRGLRTAASKGQYFSREIRPRFRFRKLRGARD
jgi:hypothetical protein